MQLFSDFFKKIQKNPKVPQNAAVTSCMMSGKAPSGSKLEVKIIQIIFTGTLKFLELLP